MNPKNNTKMLVEGAMMIALATILSYVKIWEMPFGGSVTAGSLIPILIFAYRWGGARGLFVGIIYGLLQFIVKPFAAHPISVVLDYPLAFGGLGLMGFIAHKGSDTFRVILGIVVAIGTRFICHFISGVVFFYMWTPEGMDPISYSLQYNAYYLVPELLISTVIFLLLRKPLDNIR